MSTVREIRWPRILAEGAAIIVSILLAFAIDAKWQEHLAGIEERNVLSSICAELEANLSTLDKQMSYHKSITAVVNELFNASDGIIDLPPSAIDAHILDVSAWARSGFITGAMDSLTEGGKLSLVSDNDLRSELTNLQTKYRWVDKMEGEEEAFTRHYFTPFLMKHAFLPQIANSDSTAYEGVIVPATRDYAKGEGTDHTYLLDNKEFLGLLVREKWNHQDTMFNMNDLRDRMVNVRSLIDEKLVD